MGGVGGLSIEYSKLFTALGRFVEKKGITNVCVMEFERGVIVTGSTLYDTGERVGRCIETHILPVDELKRMVREG